MILKYTETLLLTRVKKSRLKSRKIALRRQQSSLIALSCNMFSTNLLLSKIRFA